MHEIWNFLGAKIFFLKQYENVNNMSQGLPNLGSMQEKVQKVDFLKKSSRELIFCFDLDCYEAFEGLEC